MKIAKDNDLNFFSTNYNIRIGIDSEIKYI